MEERPQGERFTHVYMRSEEFTEDSTRARYRIAAWIETFISGYGPEDRFERDFIARELGLSIKTTTRGSTDWEHVLVRYLEHKDFLDIITITSRVLKSSESEIFLEECRRVFSEEALAYEIDYKGGVHPLVDDAYQIKRRSAVKGLNGERYEVTLSRVDEINKHLKSDPQNFVMAVRAIFGANENLFKMMFSCPRLDKRTAIDKLSRALSATYDGHPTMNRASSKIIASFGEWIDAAHFYRHEQGEEEPNQPDEEIAIVLISEGLSFVRWLAAIDKKMQAATPE